MFVRYFNELPFAAAHLEAVLLRDPRRWLPVLAADAGDHGDRLSAAVGLAVDGHRMRKVVDIEVGEPVRLGEKVVLPLTWRAAGAEALFPVMEGDLELAPLGPAISQLAMSARYRPPLGAVGRAIDRAVLHRVAEATIKDFVDRVAEALEAQAEAKTEAVPASGAGGTHLLQDVPPPPNGARAAAAPA